MEQLILLHNETGGDYTLMRGGDDMAASLRKIRAQIEYMCGGEIVELHCPCDPLYWVIDWRDNIEMELRFHVHVLNAHDVVGLPELGGFLNSAQVQEREQ
jgi:hypothetical protein